MKKIITLAVTAAVMLFPLGGCFFHGHDEGRGGDGYYQDGGYYGGPAPDGYYRGPEREGRHEGHPDGYRGTERDGDRDRDGGPDRDGDRDRHEAPH